MFRIASISKMVTTLGLLRLVEEGRVTLDADVSNWLGFTLRNPHFPDQPITLRHLLSHNASLRDDAGYSWGADRALKDILVPGAAHYGDGKMWSARAPAGAYFTYCNLNWAVIGTLMERVSGERFDRLMKRLVLDPLGLRGGYNPSALAADDVANIATLYRKQDPETEVWDPNGPWIAQVDDFGKKAPVPPNGGSPDTAFQPFLTLYDNVGQVVVGPVGVSGDLPVITLQADGDYIKVPRESGAEPHSGQACLLAKICA